MLEVIDPGFITTVQDLGRWQTLRYGVPISGAMDHFALMAANHLVGNDWTAAGLECYAEGPLLTADRDLIIAGAGAGYKLVAGTCSYPLWMSVFVPQGEMFGLMGQDTGRWGILAISGGIDVPEVLASRSTYLRIGLGGLEGRALRFGDHLPTGDALTGKILPRQAGHSLPKEMTPQYSDSVNLEMIPTSQFELFSKESISLFTSTNFTVSEQSDRMGYRLTGMQLKPEGAGDILSEGVVPGTIQIPADGQPVVLLSDAQTTGGYAKLGVIASADMGKFVQCPIGTGTVRFSVTAVTLTQKRWKKMLNDLRSCTWEEDAF